MKDSIMNMVGWHKFIESDKLPLLQAYFQLVSQGMHLKVDGQRKTGILSTVKRVTNVRIMKINNKGDALVHDGRTLLMVPAKHVFRQDMEKTLAVKRLALAKKAFTSLTSGDVADVVAVYKELLPLII